MRFFGRTDAEAGKKEEEKIVQEIEHPVEEIQPRQAPVDLMTEAQLARIQETRRLAETKLRNIEDSLARLRQQIMWIRQYNELNIVLEQERKHLGELNKQVSMMSEVGNLMERYELVEPIFKDYEWIQSREQHLLENKQEYDSLSREISEKQASWDNLLKRLGQARENRIALETRMRQTTDVVLEAYKSEGASEVWAREKEYWQGRLGRLQGHLDESQQCIERLCEDISRVETELGRHRASRQNMEMYEQMLLHGESVLLRLDWLFATGERLRKLRAMREEVVLRQEEENEMLSKVFEQYQEVQAQIETCSHEVEIHRMAIQGQESHTLQERASEGKRRNQMLLSAHSLWQRIAQGYSIAEDLTTELRSLNLQIEHTQESIRELSAEVTKLRHICHEKENTFILSKGQNIIQLRGGLREGDACAVCGATHHPYHSDSMLEQSRLIGSFKTEYEEMSEELSGKEKALSELQDTLIRCKAVQREKESFLMMVAELQKNSVKEWGLYVSLDSTFSDCTPSTNREARDIMLRQLVENARRDAEEAQRQLSEFNQHQDCINALGRDLTKLEQKKNDLIVRLNELNTGCQVMEVKAERLRHQIDNATSRYRDVYEVLDATISIAEWQKEWKENPEGLKSHIQQLIDSWKVVNDKISDRDKELKLLKVQLTNEEEKKTHLLENRSVLLNHIKECEDGIGETSQRINKMEDSMSIKMFHNSILQDLQEAKKEEERIGAEAEETRRKEHVLKGRLEEIGIFREMWNRDLLNRRTVVDQWILGFNQHHTPIQYEELQRIFTFSDDRNTRFRKLRELQTEQILCQSKVASLESQLIGIQAESGFSSLQDADGIQESLIGQEETLTQKRMEAVIQIAKADVAMENHQRAQKPLYEEAD